MLSSVRVWTLSLLLILGGAAALASPAVADLRVAVAKTSQVGGSAVALGDIATVEGGDTALRRKVRKLTVHRYESGETRWSVSGRAIGSALWQAEVALDEVELDIPLGASVKRQAQRLDRERVAAAVRERLAARAPDGAEVEVAFPEGVPAFEGLSGKGRLQVAPQGENQVRIRVSDQGELVASRSIPVTVEHHRRVVVASRNLTAGTRIKAADLKVAERPAAGSQWSVFRSPEKAVGSWVLKPVDKGQVVRRSRLRMSPDVRPGDPVTLVYENDNLRISAPGTVRQSGALGEVVAMENEGSGKRVYARLTGSSTAKVVDRRMSQREERR